ncbi:hypothetical protein MJO28_003902 [Puccinia striiformis f. sp. tritici]|uniref:Uncharacterized protein n=1 Tax=Puccinia striiformis f. sp. tritici TaxID=168172 RepID=A0ACC0EMI3_9BASI|nr:hypothetical protein MJO28_003902 [Puccinia striiformis f. sp. tritici]
MSEIADWESDYSESASWNARKKASDGRPSTEPAIVKKTLDRLQPSLTLLKGHFTTLARSLDPVNLNEGAESALKRALQNQQEFDGAVVHINSRFVAAVPELAPAAMQYGDQHLGRLKLYRIRALKTNFAEALDRIGTFFRFAKAIL